MSRLAGAVVNLPTSVNEPTTISREAGGVNSRALRYGAIKSLSTPAVSADMDKLSLAWRPRGFNFKSSKDDAV